MRKRMLLLPACLLLLAYCQPAQAQSAPWASLFAADQPATQVRVDRLERLAAFLDTKVPAAKFDINEWGSKDDPDDPNYVGCAAGWATKVFQREGLRYIGISQVSITVEADHRETGLNATSTFFGLGNRDNQFLFTCTGGAGRDPHKAATNIRAVIARVRAQQGLLATGDLPAQPFAPQS